MCIRDSTHTHTHTHTHSLSPTILFTQHCLLYKQILEQLAFFHQQFWLLSQPPSTSSSFGIHYCDHDNNLLHTYSHREIEASPMTIPLLYTIEVAMLKTFHAQRWVCKLWSSICNLLTIPHKQLLYQIQAYTMKEGIRWWTVWSICVCVKVCTCTSV